MLTKSTIEQVVAATFEGEITAVCDPPVWAIQRAEHPVFDRVAEVVPTHLTPREILAGRQAGPPTDWSVLSLAFPRKREITEEAAAATDLPPKSWFASKIVKTRALPILGAALAERVLGLGIDAFVAPGEGLGTARVNAGGTAYDNTWSERHVGYACGLGTFGLHGALITDAGCTHRMLSLLLKERLDTFNEVAEDPFGNCLWHARGTCGQCLRRCPAGAIDTQSRNAIQCREQSYAKNRQRVREAYALEMAGCALCMTGVPCSRTNPVRASSRP